MTLEKCKKCKGDGFFSKSFVYECKDYNYFVKCDICYGKGKVDWVRNIVGRAHGEGFIDINPAGSRMVIGESISGGPAIKIHDGREYIDENSERGKALFNFFYIVK